MQISFMSFESSGEIRMVVCWAGYPFNYFPFKTKFKINLRKDKMVNDDAILWIISKLTFIS